MEGHRQRWGYHPGLDRLGPVEETIRWSEWPLNRGTPSQKSPLENTFEKNFRAISDGTYHYGLGTPGYLVTALVFQWGVVLTSNRVRRNTSRFAC